MTDPNYSHAFLIVDRSGSMSSIRDATQDGVNEFFNGQKAVTGRRVTASLYEFDDRHDTVVAHVPVADVPAYTLVPRGMTALLDAIGFAFTREGEWMAAMPQDQRPGTVVAAIATDGYENRSVEWKADGADPAARIRELITQQRDVYGWEVLFLGANMDAIAVGDDMGITRSHSMTYASTDWGTRSAYGSLSATGFRMSSGVAFGGFSDADRAAAVDEGREDTK